jgi:hypothetical protein
MTEPKPPQKSREQIRKDKLAEQLRLNLQRRKLQTRGRKVEEKNETSE